MAEDQEAHRCLHHEVEEEKEETEDRKTPEPPEEMQADRFERLNHLLEKAKLFTTFLEGELDVHADQLMDSSKPPEKVKKEAMPKLLKGQLWNYQLAGVQWLVSLYKNGVNGILADEMGLGKTIQTIGYFAMLLGHKISGPHLIVVPVSTMPNWVKEFNKWLPDMHITTYYGTRAERLALQSAVGKMGKGKKKRSEYRQGDYGVFITTYDVAINDAKWLASHNWKTVVVDEAHRLKNFECKLIQKLRKLQTEHRILLTGTPLQNNLSELWSILNFIMPAIFDDLEAFTQWFNLDENTGEDGDDVRCHNEQQHTVITKLHAILRPFMLRRRKKHVQGELNLPPKKELVLFCHLTPAQRDYYTMMVKKTFASFMKEKDKAEGNTFTGTSYTKMNNVMMHLRKLCNHPLLFPELDPFAPKEILEKVVDHFEYLDEDGDVQKMRRSRTERRTVFNFNFNDPKHRKQYLDRMLSDCGKFEIFHKMLQMLRKRGHKVLVFSQMSQMLDIITDYLTIMGHDSKFRIDGSVASETRQGLIEEFNTSEDAFVFLLSTRAGGLGINLTAADTVIIYDSDWNPQADLQAQDRCHRIGQKRTVLVYRLVTAGTVESYLLERATKKLRLENLVIEKGRFYSRKSHHLGKQEIVEALNMSHHDASFNTVDDSLLSDLLDRNKVFDILETKGREGAGQGQAEVDLPPRKKAKVDAPPSPGYKVLDLDGPDDDELQLNDAEG